MQQAPLRGERGAPASRERGACRVADPRGPYGPGAQGDQTPLAPAPGGVGSSGTWLALNG
eukprot:3766275-Alexandrium_andersonii.AAC.1